MLARLLLPISKNAICTLNVTVGAAVVAETDKLALLDELATYKQAAHYMPPNLGVRTQSYEEIISVNFS